MDKQWLCFAQSINQHPLRSERDSVKISYLQALDYYQRKYPSEGVWAKAILALYIQKFGAAQTYQYDESQVKSALSLSIKTRVKGFKRFTYRYALISDILFMNCATDQKQACAIVLDILQLFPKRNHPRILQFAAELYTDTADTLNLPAVEHFLHTWKVNRLFLEQPLNTVLITANMSAGKSTLINALIGKRVNRMQNEACTAKLHYIYNKPYEDGLNYELDYKLELDAGTDILMTDHELNDGTDICVGTYFRTACPAANRMCIVDTPGVNSSTNAAHRSITQAAIGEIPYHKLVVVLNAAYMGTEDDRILLRYVQKNADSQKLIFVINQLDRARAGEDSVADTIQKSKAELESLGFQAPCICPVSAYAAMLVKKKMNDEPLDADETDALGLYTRLFQREEYDLSNYYATMPAMQPNGCGSGEWMEMLARTGILGLEHTVFGTYMKE